MNCGSTAAPAVDSDGSVGGAIYCLGGNGSALNARQAFSGHTTCDIGAIDSADGEVRVPPQPHFAIAREAQSVFTGCSLIVIKSKFGENSADQVGKAPLPSAGKLTILDSD